MQHGSNPVSGQGGRKTASLINLICRLQLKDAIQISLGCPFYAYQVFCYGISSLVGWKSTSAGFAGGAYPSLFIETNNRF